MSDDLIRRKAAIDVLDEQIEQCDKSLSSFDISMRDEFAVKVERASLVAFRERLEYLPPAQPEPCEDAVSRKAVQYLLAHFVDEDKYVDACDGLKHLPPVTPKQRTGKWILDRSGAYCCSECMEPCAGYVMMKPRDKFCKMCGAKMEGVSE